MAKLLPLRDTLITNIRHQWYQKSQHEVGKQEFLAQAQDWFLGTKLNDLQGVKKFPCVDVIHGCTHFIESLVLKHGWSGLQVLTQEYAYYGMMGKHGVEPDQLRPGIPLIISLPSWRWLDLRPDWPDVLRICEQRSIPIHIDFAWLTAARDIAMDLDHPCIKSFAMSLSKYAMEWNRVGLRWCRQRGMDSVTIFNHHEQTANTALTSAGAWIISQLPRDYGWQVYGARHLEVCKQQAYQPSKIIHVAFDQEEPVGISDLLINGTA